MMALAFLLQTIRIAIPYLLAAAGGVMSERVGVIALGLEGMMLAGAFGAALGSYYGGNAWVGLAGALVGGAVVTAGRSKSHPSVRPERVRPALSDPADFRVSQRRAQAT